MNQKKHFEEQSVCAFVFVYRHEWKLYCRSVEKGEPKQ